MNYDNTRVLIFEFVILTKYCDFACSCSSYSYNARM